MTPRERAVTAVAALNELYPNAACSLYWGGEPWRLLVMGRLSAQCTDARVNTVCETLFSRYPALSDIADCKIGELEEIIRPCGLYHAKAESIRASCRMLRDDFGGVLPQTMDELLRLPGVGRKIANLLLGDVFGIPGIVADTHCIRICGRLGFYPQTLTDPTAVERILSDVIPPQEQTGMCHRLVDFGRDICRARSPHCSGCPAALHEMCTYSDKDK